jgi:glycosyltransferase involved in cell wall biosynthesis
MAIIHVLTSDGSPLGVTSKSLWGDQWIVGVGGSEYAMLTMCEDWTKAGHTVVLFNDPRERNASPFEQRFIAQFDVNDKRDILINFRSPNWRTTKVHGCLKVWWSTDQLSVGNYRDFAPNVDKIVLISPRHADYFSQTYGINNAIVIDLPVRTHDYEGIKEVKIKNRLIFTSVPARGLDNLQRIYPLILRDVPDASLVITSDYRLWGSGAGNEHFRVKWMNIPNVDFVGAVPRAQLIREQLKSQITLYPSNYDELLCVAIAESQYAGSYPITSATGALPTTNMGLVLNYNADDSKYDYIFADETIKMLTCSKDLLEKMQYQIHLKAKERFSPERILKEWDTKVFNA